MDPLTAVGLAANVAQLIDLSWKVVSKSRDLYQNGALPEHRDTVTVTSDLQAVNTRLLVHLNQAKIEKDLGSDDAALRDLCESSNRIADTLIRQLQRVSADTERRRWKSFRQALKSVWVKSELDEAAARLQSYRVQLNTRILVTLRERVERLHQSTQAIASNISETRTIFNTNQEIQTEYLTRLITSQHDRTREALHGLVLGSPPSYGNGQSTNSVSSESTDRKHAEVEFLQAVTERNMPHLRKALRVNPAVIFAYDDEGQTALHLACKLGDEDLGTYLIRNGAKVNPDDDFGNIPLHYAVRAGKVALVRALLAKGADAQAKNGDAKTAHDLCDSDSLLGWLVKYGPNIETRNERGVTALYHFSVKRDLEAVSMLLEMGANINTDDIDRRSPIFIAADHGNYELIQILIKHGAQVNQRSHGSRTPLMGSAWHGHERTAELLLDSGAEIEAVNEYGYTAVDEACRHGRIKAGRLLIRRGAALDRCTYEGYAPIHQAARGGHVELIRALLEQGCDVNLPNSASRWTALHEASYHGHLECVKVLAQDGAATELPSNLGESTPLLLAVMNHHTLIAEYLVDHANANVEATDNDGRTALRIAIDRRDRRTAQSLVQRSANLNTLDRDRNSLLRTAVFNGQEDMVRFLLENGVDRSEVHDCNRPSLVGTLQGNASIATLLSEYDVEHTPQDVGGSIA